eukprot:g7619.t1
MLASDEFCYSFRAERGYKFANCEPGDDEIRALRLVEALGGVTPDRTRGEQALVYQNLFRKFVRSVIYGPAANATRSATRLHNGPFSRRYPQDGEQGASGAAPTQQDGYQQASNGQSGFDMDGRAVPEGTTRGAFLSFLDGPRIHMIRPGGKEVTYLVDLHNNLLHAADWQPNSRLGSIAIAAGNYLHLYRLNLFHDALEHVAGFTLPVHLTTLKWSPDGRYLAGGDADGGLQIWDHTSRLQSVISLQRKGKGEAPVGGASRASTLSSASCNRISQLLWSADGSLLCTATEAGKLEIWDAVTYEVKFATRLGFTPRLVGNVIHRYSFVVGAETDYAVGAAAGSSPAQEGPDEGPPPSEQVRLFEVPWSPKHAGAVTPIWLGFSLGGERLLDAVIQEGTTRIGLVLDAGVAICELWTCHRENPETNKRPIDPRTMTGDESLLVRSVRTYSNVSRPLALQFASHSKNASLATVLWENGQVLSYVVE